VESKGACAGLLWDRLGWFMLEERLLPRPKVFHEGWRLGIVAWSGNGGVGNPEKG